MGRPVKPSTSRALYVYANVDGTHIDSGENITKQVGSRRYKVTTTHGTAVCRLAATDTPAQFQMYSVAKDSDNNTYWIIKLTTNHATLVHRTLVGSAYQFANATIGDEAVEHRYGNAPIANKTVQLVNFD